jgi:Kef-type K+ transport system membrane component KefB/voltage-gated potassium channel Kch
VFAFESLFEQVALVLVISVLLGLVANALRQPLIVAFIVAGILVGPQALGIIGSRAEIELLATVGISIMLFLVGLKLDIGQIGLIGPVALATGVGQIVFTSGVGWLLALALGLPPVPALYVAVALTFSSTIIVVKILSDKRELDQLHGRIAIGFLIVQDIAVVLAMIALSAGDVGGDVDPLRQAVLVVVRGVALLTGLGVLMRWVLPATVHRMARQAELLVLFAIAWAVAVATLTVWLGFSEEVGAFLAGVALGSTRYREAIGGRLTPLRDFLLLFFFIQLGTTLELGLARGQLVAAIVLSLFVLVGNPVIVMVIMGAMRYPTRVSFFAGLTVAQISEFSLILAAMARDAGYVDDTTVALITTVGLITIGASTYLLYNAAWIYDRLAPSLSHFERQRTTEGPQPPDRKYAPEVIVIGLGRFGSEIVGELRNRDVAVLGVDFDPSGVRAWRQAEVPVLYGDAEDPELPAALPLSSVRWVISTLRGTDANLTLAHSLRHHGYDGGLALAADTDDDADRLAGAGADAVLQPFRTAADPVVERLIHPGADLAGQTTDHDE